MDTSTGKEITSELKSTSFTHEIKERILNRKNKQETQFFFTRELLKQILQPITQCFIITSCNGLPFMTLARYRFVKIIWILLISAALGTTIYGLYLSIVSYASYPIVTVTNEYAESPTLFPAITICNLNPLISRHAYNSLNLSKNFNISTNWAEFSKIKNNLKIQAMNPEYGDKNRQLLGYSISDILITCKYNGLKCYDGEFTWYYSYDYGNCFTFNSGFSFNTTKIKVPIKKTYITGYKNGLYLELFAKSKDSVPNEDYGVAIFVHNQTDKPEVVPPIILKTGTASNILISKAFISNVPEPYTSCQDLNLNTFNRNFYNVILNTSYAYKQKECFNLCLQKIIIKECGCYDLEYLKLGNARPCLNDSELECSDIQYYNFIEQDESLTCLEFCPLECYSSSYLTTLSSGGFPTDGYAQILVYNPIIKKHFLNQTNFTKDDLKKDALAVNLYINDFAYMFTKNTPQYNSFDLLGNIGNVIGNFMGLSLLSFFEIIDTAYWVFMIIIYKLKLWKN